MPVQYFMKAYLAECQLNNFMKACVAAYLAECQLNDFMKACVAFYLAECQFNNLYMPVGLNSSFMTCKSLFSLFSG